MADHTKDETSWERLDGLLSQLSQQKVGVGIVQSDPLQEHRREDVAIASEGFGRLDDVAPASPDSDEIPALADLPQSVPDDIEAARLEEQEDRCPFLQRESSSTEKKSKEVELGLEGVFEGPFVSLGADESNVDDLGDHMNRLHRRPFRPDLAHPTSVLPPFALPLREQVEANGFARFGERQPDRHDV